MDDEEIVRKLEGIENKLEGAKDVISNKIDNVKDTINKVVYGLLAIVAATVGVEFMPKSPFQIEEGVDYATRFLAIFTWCFLAFRLWQTRQNSSRWLSAGLLVMAFTFGCTMILGIHPLYSVPLRLLYSILLLIYAWKKQ